jgi:hypothetical protein
MRTFTCWAMFVGAAAFVSGSASEVNAQRKGDIEVRQLKLAPTRPPMTIYTFAGRNEMMSFPDLETLEKLMGKEAAAGLADQIDFNKEKIVLVSWSTPGPPDGVLRYQVKRDGTLEFFVEGPGGGMRGKRLRLSADFFAVPRDVEVVFDTAER